jgi:putative membrane protein
MNDKSISQAIAIVSIAIPLIVLLLFFLKPPDVSVRFDVNILPAFNAAINFSTFLILLSGYYFIRKKQKRAHRLCMLTACLLSVLFLISYLTYHTLTEPTVFGGQGWIRLVYYFILLTHIILAAAIVPLVLITLSRALQARFDKHRRLARITLPLWIYVTITGVLVYLLLRPYY